MGSLLVYFDLINSSLLQPFLELLVKLFLFLKLIPQCCYSSVSVLEVVLQIIDLLSFLGEYLLLICEKLLNPGHVLILNEVVTEDAEDLLVHLFVSSIDLRSK